MSQVLKIAILEMGVLSEELANRHGNFFELIRNWLTPACEEEVTFEQFTICLGDALPKPTDFDAYVISGSKHSVYEDLPWINESKRFLQTLKQLDIPMFGICFGHQLMAEAFGGKVEKSNKGWGVGIDEYQLSNHQQHVLVIHQDQVITAPTDSQVVGQSAHCELGMLDYDFAAKSVQFHPEFTPELVSDLLNQYRNTLGEELTKKALNKVSQANLNNLQFAQQIMHFFKHHAHGTHCISSS